MFTLAELFDPFVVVVLALILSDALVRRGADTNGRGAPNMLRKPVAPALSNQGLPAF